VLETADILCVPYDQALVRQAPGRGTTSQYRDGGGHRLNGARSIDHGSRVGRDNIASKSIMSIDILLKL
jgi:hypothetical protein